MFTLGSIINFFAEFRQGLRNIANSLFFFVFFRVYLAIFLLQNILLWASAYYVYHLIDQPRIALHYNIESGVDYYGPSYQLFVLPLLGLAIMLTNTAIFAMVRNQEDRHFVGHMLFIVVLICNLILETALYSIYLINFK